jgi:hypothetical protein
VRFLSEHHRLEMTERSCALRVGWDAFTIKFQPFDQIPMWSAQYCTCLPRRTHRQTHIHFPWSQAPDIARIHRPVTFVLDRAQWTRSTPLFTTNFDNSAHTWGEHHPTASKTAHRLIHTIQLSLACAILMQRIPAP